MILDKFKKTVLKFGLFAPGDKVLIAFSGGPDSVCLLDLLLEVQEEWNLEILLGHFNHKLREAADEEEWFVHEVAEKISLPLFLGSEDVLVYAQNHKMNLEEAARRLRYKFLEKTAVETGCARIATGHNMTDQAETFFMRLLRGSGRSGLTSIYPIVDGLIVRPLLEIEKEEIEDYLEKRELDYRLDQSNFDRRFFRNKIRLDLLPYIRDNFDPGVVFRVSRLAFLLQEEETVLEELTEETFINAVKQENGDLKLDFTILNNLPVGLARRVLRKAIKELKGDLRGIDFEDIETLLLLKEGKEVYVKDGLVLRREKNLLFLKQEEPPTVEYEIKWDGKTILDLEDAELVFSGSKIKVGNEKDDIQKKMKTVFVLGDDSFGVQMDFDRLKFPLTVRNRKKGDKYRHLGAPGKQKVKEIMRAKKIPLQERNRLPVFLSDDEIVWILGLPVNENFKVRPETKNVFVIKLEKRND